MDPQGCWLWLARLQAWGCQRVSRPERTGYPWFVQLARDIARQLAEERRLKEEAEDAQNLDKQL